jgi:hypothetical protein
MGWEEERIDYSVAAQQNKNKELSFRYLLAYLLIRSNIWACFRYYENVNDFISHFYVKNEGQFPEREHYRHDMK